MLFPQRNSFSKSFSPPRDVEASDCPFGVLAVTSRLETKLVSVTKDHVTTPFWVAHTYPTIAP